PRGRPRVPALGFVRGARRHARHAARGVAGAVAMTRRFACLAVSVVAGLFGALGCDPGPAVQQELIDEGSGPDLLLVSDLPRGDQVRWSYFVNTRDTVEDVTF